MRSSAYKQVDVFTSIPLFGNPLGVILDAEGVDPADMQRIAAWMNLSETAFVLPPTRPGADYRVRIFTPRRELPFAGHPSVGTAHALLESGRLAPKPGLVQECGAGLLPVRVLDGARRRVFVQAPRTRERVLDAAAARELARSLPAPFGATPRLLDNGPLWFVAELGSEAAVRTLAPDEERVAALCRRVGAVGAGVFARSGDADYQLVVRAFCPADNIPEDPVTGSLNAAIGAFLLANGGLAAVGAEYRASQGREVGRDGYVDVRVDRASGDVEIGGESVTVVDGTILLPESP